MEFSWTIDSTLAHLSTEGRALWRWRKPSSSTRSVSSSLRPASVSKYIDCLICSSIILSDGTDSSDLLDSDWWAPSLGERGMALWWAPSLGEWVIGLRLSISGEPCVSWASFLGDETDGRYTRRIIWCGDVIAIDVSAPVADILLYDRDLPSVG